MQGSAVGVRRFYVLGSATICEPQAPLPRVDALGPGAAKPRLTSHCEYIPPAIQQLTFNPQLRRQCHDIVRLRHLLQRRQFELTRETTGVVGVLTFCSPYRTVCAVSQYRGHSTLVRISSACICGKNSFWSAARLEQKLVIPPTLQSNEDDHPVPAGGPGRWAPRTGQNSCAGYYWLRQRAQSITTVPILSPRSTAS